MAGQPERSRQYVCKVCDLVWDTARALASHLKVHAEKSSVPQVPLYFGPPALGPGPSAMPVVPPFFAPPPAPMAAMGGPVVAPPPGSFNGWRLPPPPPAPAPARFARVGGSRMVVRPQPLLAARLPDPVVYDDGGRIRTVRLEPNPVFWEAYRMGMDPPEELDFMGVQVQVQVHQHRPASPSPSLSSWLNYA